MLTATTEYRIYVACLASYNAGTLHGEWIDANQSAEDIHAEVQAMLEASPEPVAEEWAIHDYELGGIRIDEHTKFETVAALAEALEEHGPAFVAFYNNEPNRDVDSLSDDFQEAYQGEHANLTEYAASFVEDTGMLSDVHDTVARYFDYEAFGRDMELGGDVWTADSPKGCYVFLSNV